jgi:hypothetical protein
MSYTKGPWEWTEWGNGRLKLSTPDRGKLIVMDFVRQGMNGAVARFAHWDGIEDGAPRARIGGILENSVILKTGGMHPDARLIAAAPELVEALKLWARWDDMTEAELAIALEATTAALAKAGAV